MIREIINFTEDLNNDVSDILSNYMKPQQDGVYVIINAQGEINVEYYQDGNTITPFLKNCIQRLRYSWTIEYDKKPYYQKCFDLPNKRIHSVSPFVVAFKRTYIEGGKEYKDAGKSIDKKYVLSYLKNSKQETLKNSNEADSFYNIINQEYDNIVNKFIYEYEKTRKKIKDNYYIIFLYEASNDLYQESFLNYLKVKLFNSAKLGITTEEGKILKENDFANYNILRGWSNFFSSYNAGKPFLKHLTGISETNTITNLDAKLLFEFKEYLRMDILPNPLPIFIDKAELKKDEIQNEIIKICNTENKKTYREILHSIFSKREITLQKYYLLNIHRGNIADFDFVPLFRYHIECKIYNVSELQDKNGNIKSAKISNIFDLEREFSDLFVKYNNNTGQGCGFLIGNYFGDKIESQKSFKGHTVTKETLSSYYKYRKSIYDYIYKSKQQSITSDMFDDIVFWAILSDISMDELKNGKHTKFYSIREKINIWFSLYDLFNNNNKNTISMVSKIEQLKEKVRTIADGTAHIESKEEFAFAAGQVVSWLFEKSEASNKTYAMIEPFLQKRESGLLQTAILKTIEVYIHNIKFYNGNKYGFELLSADVLTYDETVKMEPLRKYFIAGCFSPSVLKKKENSNNN
jgi:CRISPR-associated protein Csh1